VTKDVENDRLFHALCFDGSEKEIERLLRSGGASVNARDDNGFRPLHYAVLRGSKALVTLMLALGAAAHFRSNNEGWLPLHCAVQECSMCTAVEPYYLSPQTSIDFAEQLLQVYPEALNELTTPQITTPSSRPRSALSYAISRKDDPTYKVARYLITRGARINSLSVDERARAEDIIANSQSFADNSERSFSERARVKTDIAWKK
jgi:ankyrin repeat protein